MLLLTISLLFAGCGKEPEPEQVKATGFEIDASKVLIADKSGCIQVDLIIEPNDAWPLDIYISSDNNDVATVTLGAIDEDGNAVFSSDIKKVKDDLEKEDPEAAEKVVVPTDTAIISAMGYGECTINATLDDLSDSTKVIVADKRVALTFDDGSCAETAILLEGLKEEDVKATFFVTGQMSQRSDEHIDALKQAIEDGHEIGNHTYNHKPDAATLKDELKKTDKLIKSVGGEETTITRPVRGVVNSGTMKCGKAIILWSRDTMDWKYRDEKKIKKSILKSKDGDIVLMHDLYETSRMGALNAIPELKEKGFYFVTVTEMLGDPTENVIYENGEKGMLETQILE